MEPFVVTDDEREIRRIERERRRREDELLLLLLLLLIRARREAQVMAGHGYDPSPVIRRIIAGDEFTGDKGAEPIVKRAMAQAHRDGYRRAGLIAGTREVARADAGTLAELMLLYAAQAQDMAEAMAKTVADAVAEAIAAARAEGMTGRDLRAPIADAFDIAGYSRMNSYAVDVGVARAIVSAHNVGIFAAVTAGVGILASLITGLRHVSVLDENTTIICTERSGFQRPLEDPYWLTNAPPLHWNCRSVLVPLIGSFTPSERLPRTPPMAGFGMMPPLIHAMLATSP